MFGGRVGLPELLLILVIVLIFFGGRRIPDVMRGIGEGIRSFKEGMQGDRPSEGSQPPAAGQNTPEKK
jgi:sec-independent protein translocase protein TatA